MSCHALRPSELKSVLKYAEGQNYQPKCILGSGSFPKYMLFVDMDNDRDVIGKIVSLPSDGELLHWPNLLHENINPLLDIVAIHPKVNLFLSPAVGKTLRDMIEEANFVQHPMCFDRKKAYAEDILSALDYMHGQSLCLLNLRDSSVLVDSAVDRAIISDFSCTMKADTVQKSDFSLCLTHSPPPELKNGDSETGLDGIPIDMWACGVLFMQVFTRYFLPDFCSVPESLDRLNIHVLRRANAGSCLPGNVVAELKIFLRMFLAEEPRFRIGANRAVFSRFLDRPRKRVYETAKIFWKRCEDAKPVCNVEKKVERSSSEPRNVRPISSISVKNSSPASSRFDFKNLRKALKRATILRTKSETWLELRSPRNNPKFLSYKSVPFIADERNSELERKKLVTPWGNLENCIPVKPVRQAFSDNFDVTPYLDCTGDSVGRVRGNSPETTGVSVEDKSGKLLEERKLRVTSNGSDVILQKTSERSQIKVERVSSYSSGNINNGTFERWSPTFDTSSTISLACSPPNCFLDSSCRVDLLNSREASEEIPCGILAMGQYSYLPQDEYHGFGRTCKIPTELNFTKPGEPKIASDDGNMNSSSGNFSDTKSGACDSAIPSGVSENKEVSQMPLCEEPKIVGQTSGKQKGTPIFQSADFFTGSDLPFVQDTTAVSLPKKKQLRMSTKKFKKNKKMRFFPSQKTEERSAASSDPLLQTFRPVHTYPAHEDCSESERMKVKPRPKWFHKLMCLGCETEPRRNGKERQSKELCSGAPL